MRGTPPAVCELCCYSYWRLDARPTPRLQSYSEISMKSRHRMLQGLAKVPEGQILVGSGADVGMRRRGGGAHGDEQLGRHVGEFPQCSLSRTRIPICTHQIGYSFLGRRWNLASYSKWTWGAHTLPMHLNSVLLSGFADCQ